MVDRAQGDTYLISNLVRSDTCEPIPWPNSNEAWYNPLKLEPFTRPDTECEIYYPLIPSELSGDVSDIVQRPNYRTVKIGEREFEIQTCYRNFNPAIFGFRLLTSVYPFARANAFSQFIGLLGSERTLRATRQVRGSRLRGNDGLSPNHNAIALPCPNSSLNLTPPHPIPDNSPNYNHSQTTMIIEEFRKEEWQWRTRILP